MGTNGTLCEVGTTPRSDGALSAGAIAGIAVGVAALVGGVIIALVVVLLHRHRNKQVAQQVRLDHVKKMQEEMK